MNLAWAAVLLASAALAQPAAPKPSQPELTGSLSYEVASRSGAVQSLKVTSGDGGSGPYKAVIVGDPPAPHPRPLPPPRPQALRCERENANRGLGQRRLP